MARRLIRGEVWLCRFAFPDKRRPVLVMSRQDAIDHLREVTIAPITSSVRGLPSEVPLGVEHGLKGPCAVNLDHVQTVPQQALRRYVGVAGPEVMAEVCRALSIAMGCS